MFRTVASILVIAEFTIPLLAMMALKKLVDEPEVLTAKIKYVYASLGLTAGFCLLFALMPSVFFPDFISVQETQALQQLPAEYQGPLMSNLIEIRKGIFNGQDGLSRGFRCYWHQLYVYDTPTFSPSRSGTMSRGKAPSL